nr:RecName: Full=Allergen Asp fl 2; AltName: Full=Allergen Asp l 2; AltName: Allergen=Asp fl 2 [Aspergillus flavus]
FDKNQPWGVIRDLNVVNFKR